MPHRLHGLALLATAFAAGTASVAAPSAIEPARQASTTRSFPPGPPKSDVPVVVRASFELRGLNGVDEEAETFEFAGVLTLSWNDPRQAFDPAEAGVEEKIYQGAYQFNEVSTAWFPQIVLVNESGLFEKHGTILRVRSDGSVTLIETVNAVAETGLSLRHYPFDRQRVEAVFEALGCDDTEVVLVTDAARGTGTSGDDQSVHLPQWRIHEVDTFIRDRPVASLGGSGIASSFVLRVDLERQSFFMVRLVILPLALIVMLSWSVFWMDRSSLGDRISVSFIGILTVVAYQIVVSEILPQISYITLMNGFLNASFLLMCASVVINLVVGRLDQRGQVKRGDRVDARCRWIFPAVYLGLIGLIVAAAFGLFPRAW